MQPDNIFDILFSSVNLPLTIFTVFILLIWLITLLGGIDSDLDFDVDADVDFDLDLDVDSDLSHIEFVDTTNAQLNENEILSKKQRRNLKPWQVFLIYFNFVGVPFLYTFTIFICTWWLMSVMITSITNTYEKTIGFLIVFLLMIPALFLTKLFTAPLKPLFKKLNKDGDVDIDFLGRKGISLSTIKDDKLGNAEVMVNGYPMNIYIKPLNGEPILYKDSILIISKSNDNTFYYVQKYNDLIH